MLINILLSIGYIYRIYLYLWQSKILMKSQFVVCNFANRTSKFLILLECYATLCKYLKVLFFHWLAIMEAFLYLSLMLRHVNKERGREEKGVVSLATGTLLLRAQVASVLKTV